MTVLDNVHTNHISLMRKTCATLGHVLRHTPQEQAATLRDGPDGWSILEIVCHLRDFDEFFYQRAKLIISQDYPALPAYDHVALAITHAYNQQHLTEAYDALVSSRQRFSAFFEGLTASQWERAGVHPERGHFTMTQAVMQVGHHDLDHLEQITRILAATT